MRIPPVWPFSPAGRYFGGVYLLIFSLGIVAARKGFPKHPAAFLLAGLLFAVYEYFVIATRGSFVWLVPNIHLTAWALSLLMLCYGAAGVLRRLPPIWAFLIVIGRTSLAIYLYHFLILTLGMRLGINGITEFVMILILALALPATLAITWSYSWQAGHRGGSFSPAASQ
jgi:peptidoglycan/LPS O-acetylase OafA/YrhL